MKWVKRFTISFFIITIIFFAFYKPKKINLEGNWNTKTLVLNGKKIYPDTLGKIMTIAPQIAINDWSKSISIQIYRKKLSANFKYLEGKNKIKLSSREEGLNGDFEITVDTFDIKPESYTVNVKLKSNKTLIYFQKHVIIPPWKPELPKRNGRP